MHEMSIAQSLLDLVQQEMEKHGVTILRKVVVRHGRLSNIVPEALHMAWESITMDTPYASGELITEEVPLTVECRGCKHVFEPEEATLLLWACPKCGEDMGHTVKTGKEMHLQSLEAE